MRVCCAEPGRVSGAGDKSLNLDAVPKVVFTEDGVASTLRAEDRRGVCILEDFEVDALPGVVRRARTEEVVEGVCGAVSVSMSDPSAPRAVMERPVVGVGVTAGVCFFSLL